ncbi:MMPL family transporter [Luteimicrobium subarcticum]|uniref:RND superfamily putative drug exporter n=1 Tax=Luteimicrobium subarcticum TaxID=620910 RepID=A0A2M8WRV1_9MICO|nr:MMPL family transporter [Luteimicrobium subarcticum]PJI93670.1 RND superfamily putative drug exporter [Luteimicrobium subarcticum]
MTTSTTTARRSGPGAPPPATGPGSPRGVTQRVAVWSATHRRRAIGLWALMIVLAASITMFMAPKQATDLDLGVGESGRAAQTAADAGHPDPVVENALVTARTGTLDPDTADAAAHELVARLGALDEVASVSDPVTSQDGTAVLVQATMSADAADADAQVPALQEAVASVQADHPDLRVEEVGTASIDAQFQDWLGSQLGHATLLSVPLTLAILLVVFGAIVMAGIPVVLGLSSVAAGLGLWALASQALPDPGTVTDLLVLVGMAVGVDYSLFYLRRFREERRRLGEDATIDAISIAARTAGHSVVVSGLAVTLSMAGLYFAGNNQFSAMATGSILVVLVALVSSVTVLPALLAATARWSERPRVPVLWRLTGGRPRVVPALLRRVLARPVAATVAAGIALLALAAPVLGISLANGDVDEFPRTLSTMETYDRLVAEFPQGAPPDTVVVQVPAGSEDELRTQVAALDAAVARNPDVFAGTEKPWYSSDGRTAVVTVDVASPGTGSGGGSADAAPPASQTANDSVATLRDDVVPATVGSIAGATADVGGDAASSLDFTANLRHATPIVAVAVLGLTFLVMLVAFRSAVVAGLTVVLNVLSMAATFGVLTLVFQGTWAEGILGFTSSGHVVSWVPMLLFVVLSGLSLDYHVFVVSRIRENVRLGLSVREAILDGVSRTAGTITSAAAVMVGVFSLFGVLGFIELKQFGVGLVVGVVLDATVVRLVLLPATLMLARRRLWRPRPGARPVPELRSADR